MIVGEGVNLSVAGMGCYICFIVHVVLVAISVSAGHFETREQDLYRSILMQEAVSRLNELGKISDADGYLERTFMSPASMRAANILREWMRDAGLQTWIDDIGNVHGRVEGSNADAPALLIGSHYDTVIDAGKFDGLLGVIAAISALKFLKCNGTLASFKRPVELIAFSDEEGVRFQTTYLGSAAISGTLPTSILKITDKSNETVKDALKKNLFEISEERLMQLKYNHEAVSAYVEVHIEQGPVLEWLGLPLGVVKGIAGQTRLKVTVRGSQGHAGTVPMSLRQDPMTAAAELIVFLEALCKAPKKFLAINQSWNSTLLDSLASSLVCTVGEISTWPSASNVIPGQVTFTIDLRAMDDTGREAVLYELMNQMSNICEARSVSCNIERKHDANAVDCDSELTSQLQVAARTALRRMTGVDIQEIPALTSGAGHDSMAMSHLTKVGMMFVRCRGGVSHSPAEHVLDDDIWASGMAILAFLETLM